MNDSSALNAGLPSQRNLLSEPSSPTYQTTQTQADAPVKAASAPYPWILHPVIDILFSCGVAFWFLVAFLMVSGTKADMHGDTPAVWMFAFSIFGLYFFGNTHQPATLFRVYGSKVTRDSLGKPVTIMGAIALAVGACMLIVPSTAVFFLKITLAWGIQHQLAQSYGIALVYCYKRRYYLTKPEKNVMLGMTYATILYVILRMFSMPDFGAVVYSLAGYNVPFWPLVPEWVCAVALGIVQLSVLVFAGMVVRKYVKEKRIFPMPALLTIMSLVMLPLLVGKSFNMIWFLFSTWWFHSCQYLIITTSFYFKEKGLPENVQLSQIARMLFTKEFAKYYGLLFGVGFIASYTVPMWMTEHGISKFLAFATIYVTLNLHHYVTDAMIWKLRDPQIQKLLVA